MKIPTIRWIDYNRLIVDLFVAFNLAVMAVDIYIAHMSNDYRVSLEWIPFYYSLVAAVLLILGLLGQRFGIKGARIAKLLVGFSSIVVGITGFILHLGSRFFDDPSLDSLVFSAPFAAPLAFAGLGLVLIVNTVVSSESRQWGKWILFFAMCGFLGNLVMAFFDHAKSNFFYTIEWVAPIMGAFAVSFLTAAVISHPNKSFINICFLVMAGQCIVGIGGLIYHLLANLDGPSSSFSDNFIYGAPILAPMLFANLALFAFIGLWDIRSKIPSTSMKHD